MEALKRDLNTLRTGRATPSLIENISVDYYGTPTPLKQIASISAPDARAILVQPWDRQSLREIEKSLMKSEMGFNPSNDGNIVTVPIPPLTTERRQDLVKVLKRKSKRVKYRSATFGGAGRTRCGAWKRTNWRRRTKYAGRKTNCRRPPTNTPRPWTKSPLLKRRR